jgi:hypothetical protein
MVCSILINDNTPALSLASSRTAPIMSPTPSTMRPAALSTTRPTKVVKKTKKQKKIPSATTGESEATAVVRSSNFNETEDLLLCRAWVSTSLSPEHGNGKKYSVFWNDVATKYRDLQESEPCEETAEFRNAVGLKNRFVRTIQPAINEFNGTFKRGAENVPSGYSNLEEAVLEAANKHWVEEYNANRGKKAPITNFRFLHCIPTCHQIAKWNPLDVSFGEEEDDGGITPYSSLDSESAASMSQGKNAVGNVMGSSLPRPIGCKKFKAIKKEQEAQSKSMAAAFQEMVASTKSNGYLDNLSSTIKHLRKAGMVERANMLTLRLFEFMEKLHLEMNGNTPPEQPPTPMQHVMAPCTEVVVVGGRTTDSSVDVDPDAGSSVESDDGYLRAPSGLSRVVGV